MHGLLVASRDLQRFGGGAFFEKQAELISPYARQHPSISQLAIEKLRDFRQQSVTAVITKGVINDRKLCQIYIANNMLQAALSGTRERRIQTALKFTTVNQSCQLVVSSFMQQVGMHFL